MEEGLGITGELWAPTLWNMAAAVLCIGHTCLDLLLLEAKRREEDRAAVLVRGDGEDDVRETASSQGFVMLGSGILIDISLG